MKPIKFIFSGLWVDDLPQAVSYLTEKGIKFTPGGIRKGAGRLSVLILRTCLLFYLFDTLYFMYFSYIYIYILYKAGYDVTFIHPKSAVGVLVELVQYPNQNKITDIDSVDGMS